MTKCYRLHFEGLGWLTYLTHHSITFSTFNKALSIRKSGIPDLVSYIRETYPKGRITVWRLEHSDE